MMHDRGGFAIFYKLILYSELWIRGRKKKRGHHIEPKLIFFFWVKNKQVDGTSLGGPMWLGHHAFTAGAKVQSLVRELSPMQHCVVKNREKKEKQAGGGKGGMNICSTEEKVIQFSITGREVK